MAGAPECIKGTLTHSTASITSEVEGTAASVVLLATGCHHIALLLLGPLLLLVAHHAAAIATAGRSIPWLHRAKLILLELLLLLILLHLPVLLLLTEPGLEGILPLRPAVHALPTHLTCMCAELVTHLVAVHVLLRWNVSLHEHRVWLEFGLFGWLLLLLLLLVELSWLVLIVLRNWRERIGATDTRSILILLLSSSIVCKSEVKWIGLTLVLLLLSLIGGS